MVSAESYYDMSNPDIILNRPITIKDNLIAIGIVVGIFGLATILDYFGFRFRL